MKPAAHFLLRGLTFTAGFLACWAAAVFALSSVDLGDRTAFERLLGCRTPTGKNGFSLERFRELEKSGPVDVLFAGSSHAFMTFDPRVFAENGFSSFNMGSMGQSPLNTFYLLKRYLPRLRPRVVVIEGYFRTMQGDDGLESFYDTLYNAPISKELAQMTLATRNPTAWNAFAGEFFARRRKPLENARQEPVPHMRYVPGGFCETDANAPVSETENPSFAPLSKRQLGFLRRSIRECRRSGAKVLVVVQPFSPGFPSDSPEYLELSGQVAAAAQSEGAIFHDFNGEIELDEREDFSDRMHLSAKGAAKVSRELAAILKL